MISYIVIKNQENVYTLLQDSMLIEICTIVFQSVTSCYTRKYIAFIKELMRPSGDSGVEKCILQNSSGPLRNAEAKDKILTTK